MSGIACAGNWILDQVKTVDCWPGKGELANVLSETTGAGGSPFNVLIDLARLRAPFPTLGFGCLGNDARGREILRICRREGVDAARLSRLSSATTSYTDVMSVAETGERTFFHCRGANAFFSARYADLPLMKRKGIRIFHLGYLLLLDALDKPDKKYGTGAARLLKEVQSAGIQTSVDVVSEASDRFRRVVGPALRFTDHLIINEVEAEKITSIRTRNRGGMKEAAEALFRCGVRSLGCLPGGLLCCRGRRSSHRQAYHRCHSVFVLGLHHQCAASGTAPLRNLFRLQRERRATSAQNGDPVIVLYYLGCHHRAGLG